MLILYSVPMYTQHFIIFYSTILFVIFELKFEYELSRLIDILLL